MSQTDPELLKHRFIANQHRGARATLQAGHPTLWVFGQRGQSHPAFLRPQMMGLRDQTVAVVSKKKKQAMCQLQWLSEPGQYLRAKNYLLGWLGLSLTMMETCRYSRHHHTMHYTTPKGSHRAQVPATRPTPDTISPRLLFLHRLVC